MRELLAELVSILDQGRDCVYCALVETRGSTPQKAGAAMVVFADGSQSGTLGGGCVEAEVKQRALRVLADAGRAQLLTFSLDENYGWDDGLICGGRMTILAEPLLLAATHPAERRQTAAHYLRSIHQIVEQGRGCTEAVALADKAGMTAGNRFLFDETGRLVAQTEAGPVPEEVVHHLVPVQQRPRPGVAGGIAYLPIWPRITLLIVGAGHVGQAVARLAAEVDFDTWVLDDRELYARHERFPAAKRLLVSDIGTALKQLVREINPSVYCLIVTRGHGHDEEALYHLAPTTAGYVGMIGSKRKIKLIFEDLRAKGISEEALAKVHAPLGLPIGSRTVPEIAISIVAELIAWRNLGRAPSEARVSVNSSPSRP